MSTGDVVDLIGTSGGFDLTQTNIVASTPTSTTLTYSQTCPSGSGSGGTIWKEYVILNAPLANGSALPGPPGSINYSSGQISLTFSAPVQTGITVAAAYVANGWGIGNGFVDEDGRQTSWMGTEPEARALLAYVSGGAGSQSYAVRPSNAGSFAAPTMNQNEAADLVAWGGQVFAQYFST